VTNNNIAGTRSGYIEGYYGRLFDWSARHELVAVMASLGMNSYLYAPKDVLQILPPPQRARILM
jgi:hypothetical protein